MSSSNCYFMTCIQVSQETDQMVWYSIVFYNYCFNLFSLWKLYYFPNKILCWFPIYQKKKSKKYFKHVLQLKICEIYLLKGKKWGNLSTVLDQSLSIQLILMKRWTTRKNNIRKCLYHRMWRKLFLTCFDHALFPCETKKTTVGVTGFYFNNKNKDIHL